MCQEFPCKIVDNLHFLRIQMCFVQHGFNVFNLFWTSSTFPSIPFTLFTRITLLFLKKRNRFIQDLFWARKDSRLRKKEQTHICNLCSLVIFCRDNLNDEVDVILSVVCSLRGFINSIKILSFVYSTSSERAEFQFCLHYDKIVLSKHSFFLSNN